MIYFYVVFIGVLIVALIVYSSIQHDKSYIGPWETHAICECGWWTRAPFGKLFHVHHEVCPSCGEDKYSCMEVVTRRFAHGKWEVKP